MLINIRKLLVLCFLLSTAAAQIKLVPESVAYKLNLGDANNIKVTIGGVSAEFKPHVKMEFWGSEDNFTLEVLNITGTATLKDGKVSLEKTARGMDWLIDGDTFKWLFRLKSKPESNIYTLQLGGGWQQFDFIYQTPLSNPTYYMQDGVEWVSGSLSGISGIVRRERRVDGSYAVYHKTKKNHQIGKTNYRTGKAGHIQSPKATDSTGKSAWCTLHIENGTYTVTVPQKFLDEAVYPITVNDGIFGFNGEGASDFGPGNSVFIKGNVGETFTTTKVSVFCRRSDVGAFKGLVYTIDGDNSPALVKDVGDEVTGIDETPTWHDSNLNGVELASGDYYAGMVEDGVAQHFDGGGPANSSWHDASVTYATPQDNPTGGSSGSFKFSVYVTWASVGAAPSGQLIIINMAAMSFLPFIIISFLYLICSVGGKEIGK